MFKVQHKEFDATLEAFKEGDLPLNRIHETAVIEDSVKIGENNIIGPYVVLRNGVQIGDNNYISPFVVIGEPPEHRAHAKKTNGRILIGNGNVIHEHVAIQKPIERETVVGDMTLLMHGAHIAHDVELGNETTLAPFVVLGGHSTVGRFANLGMGVLVHQRVNISMASMVGMNATVTRDTLPGSMNYGVPSRFRGWNKVGLEKIGIDISPQTHLESDKEMIIRKLMEKYPEECDSLAVLLETTM